MTRTIHFTKMHGAGNDYIYINTVECSAHRHWQRWFGAHWEVARARGRFLYAHIQCRWVRGHDVRKRVKMYWQVFVREGYDQCH